jgi:hypothetical protein
MTCRLAGRDAADRRDDADILRRLRTSEFRPTSVQDVVAMCVRVTPHDPTPPIHTHQQGRDPLRQRSGWEGGTPMRRIVTIIGLTGVLALRGVRIGGAEERWVLWQEEWRPSGEHRWTPVGTDPGGPECEALRRHILGQMSREPDVRVTDDLITQTVPGV